jgi:hypothetical protein
MMTNKEELDLLRASAPSEGMLKALRGTAFLTREEYLDAIKALEARSLVCIALDEKFTPLEMLGATMLRSAYK